MTNTSIPMAAYTAVLNGAAFKVLLDAVDGRVGAGRSTATAPLDATIRLWVGLHGLVTLHASLPWFPWPPLDTLLVEITDRLTDLREPPPGGR